MALGHMDRSVRGPPARDGPGRFPLTPGMQGADDLPGHNRGIGPHACEPPAHAGTSGCALTAWAEPPQSAPLERS